MTDWTTELNGYQIIQLLYESSKSLVYRAQRTNDRQTVVIKFIQSEYPSFQELVQFRNQYTLTKNLDLAGIVRPYSLEPHRNGYALIMEDVGGISLQEYMASQPLNFSQFLPLAIQLAEILHGLYQNRVIHKDIKPANILIHPTTQQIKLIDFSIASVLPRETQEIKNPNLLEGTLAYLSPEQTGRMNRGIDYRSDYYSVGVTFYEMLTGQLPFQSNDPLEILHCHLAQQPPDLCQAQDKNSLSKSAEIPQIMGEIVRKLMAKNAEDRYQTAFGLKSDLETCLNQLEKTGTIQVFELGSRDVSDRFLIPEKLYGREVQVQQLLEAFGRVASPSDKKCSELILISGFSGIGKTAVVNEVHKPIVRQRGYFIKGKFDQFQRNIPLSAFVQAFRDLIEQLLSENETQLQHWKHKILEALGDNGQVIVDVLPELKLIIGQQKPVAELSGNAAQSRFNFVFQRLIQTLTTNNHPLVIFLDDLQWADLASLKLIQVLMSDLNRLTDHSSSSLENPKNQPEKKSHQNQSNGGLLLIGAYRDHEVDLSHPLILTLEEIQKTSAIVTSIKLSPLRLDFDLNPLVADTLHCSPELALPLTQLIHQKTKGNPFFVTQFLKNLYKESLITFNSEEGYWECDIAQVKLLSLSGNIVEFMASQLQKLNSKTQNVLKLAACIGNKFDLENLAIICEQSMIETATDLEEALQEGLVLPLTEVYKFYTTNTREISSPLHTVNPAISYKFLHDRVQQAAYFLIPEAQKKATHYKIGQLLLQNTGEAEREDRIFEIANQLNYGIELITSQAQRDQLAQFNLKAGRKAKVSTAYKAAIEYLITATKLLSADSWKRLYQVTREIYKERAELEYLNGNFEESQKIIDIILAQSKSALEQAEVYYLWIVQQTLKGQYSEAIETGIEALELLDLVLPRSDFETALEAELAEAKERLRGQEISAILDIQDATDPQHKVRLKLLTNMAPSAYLTQPKLYPILMMKIVNQSLKKGNLAESALGYSSYGLILGSVLGDYALGYQFGQLAIALTEKFNNPALMCRSCFTFCFFINHWKKHINQTIELENEGYEAGLEAGELQFSGYIFYFKLMHRFFQGENLSGLINKINTGVILGEKTKNLWQIDALIGLNLALSNLDNSPHNLEFNIEISEEKYIETCHTNQSHSLVGLYYFLKGQVLYLLGHYKSALNCLNFAQEGLQSMRGILALALHNFYESLTLTQLYPQALVEQKEQYWQQIEENQKKMKIWADNCPENFLHKYLLVQAEITRITGQFSQASQFYNVAISSAKKYEYFQEEALAHELAAKLYLEYSQSEKAKIHLTKAYYGYARWGAKSKIDELEKSYPLLLKSLFNRSYSNLSSRNSQTCVTLEQVSYTLTKTDSSMRLDLTAVMKAAHAICGEIKLEKLISTLMQVTLENAGAQKGCLILNHQGNWRVEVVAVRQSHSSEELQLTSTQSLALELSQDLPISIIHYVARTQQNLVLDHAMTETQFLGDSYIIEHQPKSVLCTPIINRNQFIGILYLENNLTIGAFTRDRIEVLNILTAQAAISLENAQLYENLTQANHQLEGYSYSLEQKVQERTQELNQKNQDLAETLQQLQKTQAQLIHQEKLTSLGQVVAGIAHEINNPVGFISSNIEHAFNYLEDLFSLIKAYQQEYPNPTSLVQKKSEEIELDFLTSDLKKILNSMQVGSKRIQKIVEALKNFSRLDESEIKPVDLYSGIESTLIILQNRLNLQGKRPAIEIVKQYSQLPLVNCYAAQLNQVFMNILTNAIDALEQAWKNNSAANFKPQIVIQTQLIGENSVQIRISDNGCGMSEAVQAKIFDPFFSTKPVGSGTGLGLSVAHSIIVEKHGGRLTCHSEVGEGTEFILEIPMTQI